MRRVGGYGGMTKGREYSPAQKQITHTRISTTIVWEKRSARLWTGEKDGRHFRIERCGMSYGSTGTVVAVEVDQLQKPIRREPTQSATTAKVLIETWLTES